MPTKKDLTRLKIHPDGHFQLITKNGEPVPFLKGGITITGLEGTSDVFKVQVTLLCYAGPEDKENSIIDTEV